MHDAARRQDSETATTTLEFVGLAVAAAALVAGIGAGLQTRSDGVGDGIVDRIGRAVSGEQPTRRWRDAHEVRREGGSDPVRVARDELRMSPVLDPLAWWDGAWRTAGTHRGVRATLDAKACVACASLEWSHELGPRAATGSAGSAIGIHGEVGVAARAALASVEVGARAERELGEAGEAFAQGRVRATVGGEADGSARVHLGADAIDVEVDAGAMAGGVARAEARAGIDLLGVAIRQSGRVEGWAGAGARGTAGIRREGGVVSWRFGWGAALGLGGAAEWSGSVDVTRVSSSHRRLARDALRSAIAVSGIRIPVNHLTRIGDRP